MATTTSAATAQPYGVKRVCQVWGVPRVRFKAMQSRFGLDGFEGGFGWRGWS